MKKLSLFTAGVLLMMAWLAAQEEVVHFKIAPLEGPVAAGTVFDLVLRAEVEPGWHLYSMTPYPEDVIGPQPTTIRLEESPVFRLAGEVRQPQPHVSFDPNFAIDTEYFEGVVDFVIPVAVESGAESGLHPLTTAVRFMACNDRLCLPPQVRKNTLDVTVGGEAPAGAAPPPQSPALSDSPSPPSQTPDPVSSGGALPAATLAYIWFAMAMGGLALLTPCVFPMIPITVSYFTKREVSRRRAVGEAALYSLGIILTFTLLGFLLTAVFGAGGINRVATSPLVNVAIASIFILFALSLFGVVELRLPSSWLTSLDKRSGSGGVGGILLMGLTFSLTSFTCTVPFVGTVMVTATQGDWLWSLLGVTAFATVFSAPFFLLALFPSWLKTLPKSGSWMNSVKITMGFLELAAALKFISNVDLVYQWEIITRPVFITVWLALALVTTLYLLGKFYFPHETPAPTIGAGRVLSSVFFLSVSFYLLRGLFGFPLGELDAFLPPRDYGTSESAVLFGSPLDGNKEEKIWLTDYQEGLRVARAEGKTVFIDFTGYTCTNCRWMETNIFTRPRVAELFDQLVLVRLYTDGVKPEHEANLQFEKERFGTIALPLYALMSPEDQIIATFPGLTRSEDEFVAFLEKGVGKADFRMAGGK